MDVLNTVHRWFGDTGKYFNFNEEDFNEMVGNEDWSGETFDVIQKGSQSWAGLVIVWKGNSNHGAHGRRYSGGGSGQWAKGDSIELKSCVDYRDRGNCQDFLSIYLILRKYSSYITN